MHWLCLVIISMSVLAFSLSCSREVVAFGSSSLVKDSVISVSSAVNISSFEKKIRVKGRVQMVCPDDACWILLEDNANVLRVEFADHSMIPQTSLEWEAVTVEGVLRQKVVLPNTPGFEAYEKSCSVSTQKSQNSNKGSVFEAYRIELQ